MKNNAIPMGRFVPRAGLALTRKNLAALSGINKQKIARIAGRSNCVVFPLPLVGGMIHGKSCHSITFWDKTGRWKSLKDRCAIIPWRMLVCFTAATAWARN
jgi:hypothetical protein